MKRTRVSVNFGAFTPRDITDRTRASPAGSDNNEGKKCVNTQKDGCLRYARIVFFRSWYIDVLFRKAIGAGWMGGFVGRNQGVEKSIE